MPMQTRQSRVKSPRVTRGEGFHKNDLCRRSGSIGNLVYRFVFCSWFARRYITYAFFRIIPPIRYISNALTGIEKLKTAGILSRGDTGFDEILKVIKDNRTIEGKVQQIRLIEVEAHFQILGISPKIEKFLQLDINGKPDNLPTDPFDPDKAIRELKEWVKDSYREQLAYWMLGVLAVWLVANSYMLYILNR